MGSCVSCIKTSHDQSDLKFRDSQSSATIPDVQTSGVIRGGGGMRESYAQHHSSSSSNAMIAGGDEGGGHKSQEASNNTSVGIKGEKKTFYSRIPPLGRSGSDKKGSLLANTSNSIKDNNNAYSESKIQALFEIYKDPDEDAVLPEGIERLCKDLEVKPEDFKILVLAWKFGAEQMCRFTREEFFYGMKELKTDTLQGIQGRLPDVVKEVMNDSMKFKDLYRFSFMFGLDSDLGQRILPIDMAVSLWRVVFSCKEPPLLERWILFLENSHSHIQGIQKDTWNMFLNLVETVGTDLSNYDDTEAWPSLFDDFVEFENDPNQNTISNISDKEQQFHIQQGIENSLLFDSSSTQRLSNCSPGATNIK